MRASQLSSGANRTSAPASHAIASTSMPFAESMPSSCKSFSAAVIDLNADCPDRRSRPSRGDPAVYRQSRVRTHLHPCVPPSSCAPGGGRRLPQTAQESPACESPAGGTSSRQRDSPEERRVGKESGRTCRYRGATYNEKKKKE